MLPAKKEIQARRARLRQRVDDDYRAYKREVVRLAALPETELMEREQDIEEQLRRLYGVLRGIMGNRKRSGKKKHSSADRRANPTVAKNVLDGDPEAPPSSFSNSEVE